MTHNLTLQGVDFKLTTDELHNLYDELADVITMVVPMEESSEECRILSPK